jgi:hypothetical protein
MIAVRPSASVVYGRGRFVAYLSVRVELRAVAGTRAQGNYSPTLAILVVTDPAIRRRVARRMRRTAAVHVVRVMSTLGCR